MEVRKIRKTSEFSFAELEKDLQKYTKMAKEAGADYTKIIEPSEIVLDYRVRYKCWIPTCYFANTNPYCPPRGIEFEETKKLVNSYSMALLVGKKWPATQMAAQDQSEIEKFQINPDIVKGRQEFWDIVRTIESQAFYDGHYLALGLASGCCKIAYCHDKPDCAFLKKEGCRFPLRARPSMEATGIDVLRMMANAGWEVYPIGAACGPNDVPHSMRAGLILIT